MASLWSALEATVDAMGDDASMSGLRRSQG
jgi:hypothetical protein